MDKNFPPVFPIGANNPPFDDAPLETPEICEPCKQGGSVIETETQVLGEDIDLAGVPFSLHYRSRRAPGYASDRTVRIPIITSNPPAPLKRVDVTVDVAGKRTKLSFPPTAGQPDVDFTWDGRDAYGRAATGSVPAKVRVGWVYDAGYGPASPGLRSFGQPSQTQTQLAYNQGRAEAIAWRSYDKQFQSLDARGWGIGGWTLGPHHLYDQASHTLHLGDGTSRKLSEVTRVLRRVTGATKTSGATTGIPGPASGARFGGDFRGLASAADGSLYLVEFNSHSGQTTRLYKIDPQGMISAVTGPSTATTTLGGLASQTRLLNSVTDVAVGKDGAVYLADGGVPHRVLRIDPVDQKIRLFAGGGTLPSGNDPCAWYEDPLNGEGGPALGAAICLYPGGSKIEVGPDGSVYFSRSNATSGTGNGTLRRVRPDGILETVILSTGNPVSSPEGKLARQLTGRSIDWFTLDSEGRIYFTASYAWANGWIGVYTVRPEDHVVERVAGEGDPADGIGDGLPALDAAFGRIDDVAVAPDGRIFVIDELDTLGDYAVVRSFTRGGAIRREAGNGTLGVSTDGGSAVQAPLAIGSLNQSLVVMPNGIPCFDEDSSGSTVIQVRSLPPPVQLDSSEITIASEDGSELYDFDPDGRHLRTRNAQTGEDLLTFGYDSAGHLIEIRAIAPSGNAADDQVTTVEWAGSHPTAIVGPYGARTELAVDANGYLSSVEDPLGQTHTLESTSSGLLTSFVPPTGGEHSFTYDALGRLVLDEDPAGGSQELSRTDIGDQATVSIETALDRIRRMRVEPDPAGGQIRRFTQVVPGSTTGLNTDVSEQAGDSSLTTAPDGMRETITYGADPRLSLAAPIVAEQRIKTPANLERVRTHTRTATVSSGGDLLTQTDTIKLNNRTTTVSYNGTTRRATTDTPLLRRTIEDFDAQGRLTASQLLGLDAVSLGYDGRGRLTSTSQGSGQDQRTTGFAYDSEGNLASVTDALNRPTSFAYDDAGRVTHATLPGNREIAYAYDANGNLASLTPPGQPAHIFRYTTLDQESEYEPPAVEPTTRALSSPTTSTATSRASIAPMAAPWCSATTARAGSRPSRRRAARRSPPTAPRRATSRASPHPRARGCLLRTTAACRFLRPGAARYRAACRRPTTPTSAWPRRR
jgi:YD repeat-containing protein